MCGILVIQLRSNPRQMKVNQTIIYPYDLKKLARQKGMTMPMLAKKLGVSRQYIWAVNSNLNALTEKNWEKLKQILDINYDETK